MITINDVPASLVDQMEGPRPVEDFACDGCTASPDYIAGADMRPACLWHDFAYKLGGDSKSRLKSDQEFYRNLRRCDASRTAARLYYFAVRLHGIDHFNWWRDRKKDSKLVVFFTRFLRW